MSRFRQYALVFSAMLATGALAMRDARAGEVAVAAAPSPAPQGVLVLAGVDAADAAWPLAQQVYASGALRPRASETQARVLAGERPAQVDDDARELTELCDGVKGEDAASRQVLSSIASRFGAKGIVVVAVGEGRARARLFVAQSNAFDAARYDADGDAQAPVWKGVVSSLERTFPLPPPPAPALQPTPKPLAPPAPKTETSSSKPFYLSWWFWGAVGAAAVTGLVLFAATRDQDSSNIHLTLEMPK